jgi:hypothetical protein
MSPEAKRVADVTHWVTNGLLRSSLLGSVIVNIIVGLERSSLESVE